MQVAIYTCMAVGCRTSRKFCDVAEIVKFCVTKMHEIVMVGSKA